MVVNLDKYDASWFSDKLGLKVFSVQFGKTFSEGVEWGWNQTSSAYPGIRGAAPSHIEIATGCCKQLRCENDYCEGICTRG